MAVAVNKSIGQKHLTQLKRSAQVLVDKHGGIRKNGAVASIRTKQMTAEVLLAICERLWNLGYQLRDIREINGRHVEALIRDWHEQGFAIKTVQNNLSRLRRAGAWIGKPGLVERDVLKRCLPHIPEEELRVKVVATASKSWSENGVDVLAKIQLADSLDARFGAMLRLGVAFGLRRKEQLRGKPHMMDAGAFLVLRNNMTKNGKDRDVPIEHPFQRIAIEHAKRITRKDEFLGWPGHTYDQNVARYKYLMRKIGITGKDSDCVGHGLRAEYAENIALLYGLVPPVLGGKLGQVEEDARLQIQLMVSRNMGHHRPNVTGAYYGSFRPTRESPT